MQSNISLARAVRAVSLLGLFSVATAGTSAPVLAQQVSEPADIRPSVRSTIEEVVVTARRRDESAQDVPIALSVVSSEALAATGAFNLTEVQRLAPSLQIMALNPRNTNINIRGLGANVALANDGLENGVGVYIDNVYYGRPGQSQFDLIDLQQIEVLRGPQGTLFGKNTTAGAVNITTSKPSIESSIQAEGTYANEGYRQLRTSLTGPLVDETLAYRLTIGYTERGGLVDNVHTGQESNDYVNETVRGQLLYQPTDDVEVRIIGDYSSQESNGVAQSIAGVFDTYNNGTKIANNFNDRIARAGYTPVSIDPYDRKVDLEAHYQANMESYGLSAQVDWQLEDSKLTSITAYRGWNWNPGNDMDGTSLSVLPIAEQSNRQRQFSQEIRLASNGNELVDYVAGVYYLWQRNTAEADRFYGTDAGTWFLPNLPAHVSNAALGNFGGSSFLEPTTHSYAAFGQLAWHLSEKWELTTGLRYTYEDKEGVYRQAPSGGDLSGLTPTEVATVNAVRNNFYGTQDYVTERTDESVSGLISLSYAITDDVLAYASYSRGGKSGGLNLTNLPAGVESSVDPETVDNYEIGLKSQWLDSRLTANLAVFNTEIDKYQSSITEARSDGSSVTYIASAGKVRSRGAELDLSYQINDYLSVNSSVAYTEATFLDYANAQQAPEREYLGKIQDLTGEKLPGVPVLAWNIGLNATLPLDHVFNDVELYGNANYAYRDGYNTVATKSIHAELDDLGLLSARVGLRTYDGHWDLSLWAKNLTNEDYLNTMSVDNSGLVLGVVAEPRLIGATLRANF